MYLFPYIQKSHNISLVFSLSLSPVCRGCCTALSPRWWRSYCHDWVSSSSWISSVSPGRTERINWARWCHPGELQFIGPVSDSVFVIGRNMLQQSLPGEYVHHPHLHFNTALIHHTDTSTGTRDDGGRCRNATVQRQATERERDGDRGYVCNRRILSKNMMWNRTHYAMINNSNSIMLHCCHMTYSQHA